MKKYNETEERLRFYYHEQDNCLDPMTFEELIMTIQCNTPDHKRTPEAVKNEFIRLLEMKVNDAKDMFNLMNDKIMKEVRS